MSLFYLYCKLLLFCSFINCEILSIPIVVGYILGVEFLRDTHYLNYTTALAL